MNKREAAEDADSTSRVRIPQAMRFDFTLRPQPKIDMKNVPSTKIDPDSKKAKLMKRMQVGLSLSLGTGAHPVRSSLPVRARVASGPSR